MLIPRFIAVAGLCACVAMTDAQASDDIKVFILAGQSNMQGHGRLETGKNDVPGGIGTLREQVNINPGKYGHLVDTNGDWATRSDVWVWSRNGTDTGKETGDLGVTYGVDDDRIGPEVGFGNVVGDAFDEQVVLIKTAWGGKSLRTEFRPPSAVSKRGGVVGDYYTIMVDSINEALVDVAAQFPGRTIDIEGFGWHQGFNDRLSRTNVDEYEDNLNDLIADLRNEFSTPDMKVVIGTTSTGSDTFFVEANRTGNVNNAIDRVLDHVAAQKAVGDNDPNAHTVDTRPYWRPAELSPRDQGFHWNQNGETMYLIGEEMGVQMVNLVPEPSSMMLLGLGGLMAMRRRR